MLDNDAPRVQPVWTPGAHLAGFIKRTTIHCYTQNMNSLHGPCGFGKDYFMFSNCKSLGLMTPGLGPTLTQGA